MPKIKKDKCPTCGKKAHDFEKEEALSCVPPKNVLKFGSYRIDEKYRDALYKAYPFYTTEEVVGSYLGHNPHFSGQDAWFDQLGKNFDEDKS